MGRRFVFAYKYEPTSFLILVFKVLQFRGEPLVHSSTMSAVIERIESIKSSDSRTYTNPREIISGPDTHSPVSLSIEITAMIIPSARCFLSRRTMLPTSPTPYPSTSTLPDGTVPINFADFSDNSITRPMSDMKMFFELIPA